MLRITITTDGSRTRIALEGRLVGPWVDQLQACWLRERATHQPGALRIDLVDVSFIDAAGKRLLSSFHEQGAQLTATNLLARATLQEIVDDG
jgi:ABC-type transporter Mla MlaB component